MTYAGERTIFDADSHVMELADFLDDFIDDEHRRRLRRTTMEALKERLNEAVAIAEQRRTDPGTAAEATERLMTDKGWRAMGAFDPEERSRVLDLLGFEGQLVFATFASSMYAGKDTDLLYAGSCAQNQAVARFCAHDPRLLPVAYVPLVDPERAVAEVTRAIVGGSKAVMVPSTAAGERAPTHPDLDPFWDVLNESDVPFVLHVGGGGRMLDRAFHNNGRPVTDHLGGGENIRSKDYLAIHHSPEIFLGVLVLDGLFDRFPRLRGGCIEQGASWVVSWLQHLDGAPYFFGRTEAPLRDLAEKPSDYVRRHLKFTPFPGEPVGWLIERAGPELFMFSTDYPHPEGTKDPLRRFEATLSEIGPADKQRFFAGNFAELMGSHVPGRSSRRPSTQDGP
jgi:predicted TIM-barrel fold metal-dependent hydrolase